MHYRFTAILLTSVVWFWSAPAGAAELSVPGGYAAIADAIAAAEAGDTVIIDSGRFTENLHIDKSIHLRGAGAGETTVQGVGPDGSALRISNAGVVSVTGITFQQIQTREMDEAARQEAPLVYVSGGTLRLESCNFHFSAGHSIVVDQAGEVEIVESDISKNYWHGVLAEGAGTRVKVLDSNLSDNRGDGLRITFGARAEVTGSKINGNQFNGLVAEGHEAYGEFVNNECRDNGADGILFNHRADGKAEGNRVSGSVGYGILANMPGTVVEIRDNESDGNGKSGVGFALGAAGVAEGNTCRRNGWAGLDARTFGTAPEIRDNVLVNNEQYGLMFGNGAQGVVTGNRCEDNMVAGVVIFHRDTAPEFSENIVRGNVQDWMEYRADPAPDSTDYWHIYWLLLEGNYDEVEAMAARMRQGNTPDLFEGSAIGTFYAELTAAAQTLRDEEPEKWAALWDSWRAAYPDRATTTVVEAKVHIRDAWDARGGDYAHTVTDQGWKTFRQEMEAAEAVLEKAQGQFEDDPEFYRTYMSVGLGLRHPTRQVKHMMFRGLEIDRDYHGLVRDMAWHLMPRWYGQPGDIGEFAAEISDWYGPEEGPSVYARIAAYVLGRTGQPDYGAANFDYERLREGYEHLLIDEEFNDFFRNMYCYTAALEGDTETARQHFAYIGDDWNRNVWENELAYKRWRAYAEKGGPRPETELEYAYPGSDIELTDIFPSTGVAIAIFAGLLLFSILLFGVFIAGVVWLTRRA